MLKWLKSGLKSSLIKISLILGVLIVLGTGFFSFKSLNVNAAGIESLNILGINCLFKGAPGLSGGKCEAGLVESIVGFLFTASVPIAILVIMWGGYQYFLGGFDGKSNGMKNIQAAVIGLLIVLLAQFIVGTITGGGDSSKALITAGGQINSGPLIAFIGALKTILVTSSGAVAGLVLIWGGYKYFFSGLDMDKKGGADAIRNGAVGLVVVLIANGLFDTVASLSTAVAGAKDGTPQAIISVITGKLLIPVISDVTTILFSLSTAVAVLVVMWGGYKYYLKGAGGAKEDGLSNIRNGIIGLITVFVAKGIVQVIQASFPGNGTKENPISINQAPILNFIKFITSNIMIPTAAALAVFFFALGGFYWVTSGGDSKKAEKAKSATVNAIVGLVVLLFGATVVALVNFIFLNGNIAF